MQLSTLTLLAAAIVLFCAADGSRTPDVKPIYGTTNPTPAQIASSKVKRFASIIELRPEKERYYRELHANVWPEVVAAINKANIRNYTIYIATIDGKKYLFSHLEYVGDNAAEDFASIAKDSTTKNKWWPETDACQKRLPGTPEGEQWLGVEMLMHIE